jgi:hypothetical protein
MSTACRELGRHELASDPPQNACAGNDCDERDLCKKDERERRDRRKPQSWGTERFLSDAKQSRGDKRNDCGRKSVENGCKPRHATGGNEGPAQRVEDEDRWQHKQRPRRDAAADTVQPPAEIRRELLRLRPREKCAEIQRMEKMRIGNPASLVHEVRGA